MICLALRVLWLAMALLHTGLAGVNAPAAGLLETNSVAAPANATAPNSALLIFSTRRSWTRCDTSLINTAGSLTHPRLLAATGEVIGTFTQDLDNLCPDRVPPYAGCERGCSENHPSCIGDQGPMRNVVQRQWARGHHG